MRSTLSPGVVAASFPILCALAAGVATAQDEAPAAPTHVDRARAIVEELADQGVPIDLEKLSIEVKDRAACHADLERQQQLFFRPSHFLGLRTLWHSFGLPAGKDAADFRRGAIQGMTNVLQAYYQSDRSTLVFLEGALGELAGIDPFVAHELVHASQDQQRDLTEFLTAEPRTNEMARVRMCVMEGEAELYSAAVVLERAGRSLADLDPETLSDELARMLSGEVVSLPYTAGLKMMLSLRAEGGDEAVRALWAEPPPSTEQVLHPQKRGSDQPVALELPPWPAEGLPQSALVHDDVIGELTLYGLLLEAGVERKRAYLAAAGWDGDALRVYRLTDEGEERQVAVWRTVWDREVDAEQALTAFQRASLCDHCTLAQRSGRAVDLVACDDPVLARKVLAWLAKEGAPKDSEALLDGADSTARVEAEFLKAELARGGAKGDRFELPRYGVSVPIPQGFTVREVQGVKILAADPKGGFADNIAVTALANLGGKDAAALLEENRTGFAAIPSLKLTHSGIRKIGGREVVYLEYEGKVPQAPLPLRFATVLFLREGQQVLVTATATQAPWADTGPRLTKALSGLRFSP
ncbi:MAG: hypothetical protein ACYS22_16265 [Planctomycetota bacterium]